MVPSPSSSPLIPDEEDEEEYNKALDAEDIILDKLSLKMAEENIKLFRKYLFRDNHADLLLPQIAKVVAYSSFLFIEGILRGAKPVPGKRNELERGASTPKDAKIDIVNMTTDIMRLFIGNKHTEFYPPKTDLIGMNKKNKKK